MGAENSKPTPNNRDNSNEMAIQRALEQQRRMYEAKYSELIQTQRVIHESINQSINRNGSPSNLALNTGISTSNSLYPNLQTVANNNNPQVTNTNHNLHRPSTSNNQFQSSTSSAPSVPPAPIVPSSCTIPTAQTVPSSLTVSSPLTVPSSHTVPSHTTPTAPSASINNNNDRNISNRGAIPKARRRYGKKKNMSVGVECVTCKSDFGLQIYQCQNGHSSCNGCRFSNRLCGLCSKPITDVRNITLETTIAEMTIKETTTGDRIKCRNAKDGCCLSFFPNEMDNHVKECPFQDMECPLKSVYDTCNWKGKINQISTHFKDVHPLHCEADVDKEMSLINVNTDQRLVYFVTIGSFHFLIHFKVIENEKIMYMTVQLLGTKVSALKWIFELHVYNKNAPQRKFLYIDVCHSNAESVDDIFNQAQCAVLNLDYIQTFVNNGCLNYKLFLKNKSYARNVDQ